MIERDRLFAEHMFACLCGLDCPFGMQRMWRRNIDRLDSLIGQHRFIAIIASRNIPGAAKTLSPRLRAAPHCYQLSRLRLSDTSREGMRDVPCANNPPVQLRGHGMNKPLSIIIFLE